MLAGAPRTSLSFGGKMAGKTGQKLQGIRCVNPSSKCWKLVNFVFSKIPPFYEWSIFLCAK